MQITKELLKAEDKLSTGKSEEAPVEPQGELRKLGPKEVSLKQRDPMHLYGEECRKYCQKMGFSIAASIEDALNKRGGGIQAFTYREIDIILRSKVDMTKPLLIEGAKYELFVEDIAGLKDSVYELRKFYNRGVEFFKSDRSKGKDQDYLAKARLAMVETLDRLQEKNLPAWEEEKKFGFPHEFCRPEFMTDQQYMMAMKNPVRFPLTAKEIEDDDNRRREQAEKLRAEAAKDRGSEDEVDGGYAPMPSVEDAAE